MLERRHREARGPGAPVLSDDAARLLEQAPWPGNLRQLDNVVRRAYVLANAEGGGARALHVEEPHVRDSLLAEGTPGSGIPANPLREAAARFVDEALRRSDGLDLDLLTGLRGFVLEEAIRRTGNKEDAFRLFRRDNLVKGRNHHKTLQREISRAADLSKALGVPESDSRDP
jgi:DNA-binding NtrC family response regulator